MSRIRIRMNAIHALLSVALLMLLLVSSAYAHEDLQIEGYVQDVENGNIRVNSIWFSTNEQTTIENEDGEQI